MEYLNRRYLPREGHRVRSRSWGNRLRSASVVSLTNAAAPRRSFCVSSLVSVLLITNNNKNCRNILLLLYSLDKSSHRLFKGQKKSKVKLDNMSF